MKEEIEFNNGFVTALCLFLEHKNLTNMPENISKDTRDKLPDMRLYAATDHLYQIEMPDVLSEKLKNRIKTFKGECFENRLKNFTFKDNGKINELFEEAENILAQIDKEIFKTKKVVMNYR